MMYHYLIQDNICYLHNEISQIAKITSLKNTSDKESCEIIIKNFHNSLRTEITESIFNGQSLLHFSSEVDLKYFAFLCNLKENPLKYVSLKNDAEQKFVSWSIAKHSFVSVSPIEGIKNYDIKLILFLLNKNPKIIYESKSVWDVMKQAFKSSS